MAPPAITGDTNPLMHTEPRRVVLPVEVKRRELTGKLLLTLVLAARGYTVYFGSTDLNTVLDRLEPHVYFELSAVDRAGKRDRLSRLKQCGVTTFVLDTEGSAFGDATEFRPRVSEEMLAYTDCYLAWGSKGAQLAADAADATDTRVETTGNPRFDLLREPYRQVYADDADAIRSEYGPFVLFNTNFSINHLDLSHNREFSLVDPTEQYKTQTKILGAFLSAVATLADRLQDTNVVVRPHPSEDPALYRRLFSPYENVVVKKKGEVRPWILAAEAVVHNSCTTGVTSALLGTPVFAYVPNGHQLSKTPNFVSKQQEDLATLLSHVEAVVGTDATYSMTDEQVARLKEHVDNTDYVSAERIADLVQSMDTGSPDGVGQRFDPPVKHRIKRALVRTVGPKRFERLYYQGLRGGRDAEYKFSRTTVEELQTVVGSFPGRVVPDGLRIDPIPGMINGFRVRTKVTE